MFDIKKKVIVPDVLRDIQHRQGRINLSEGVIANFVFNRTALNNVTNRSNSIINFERISDIIFFDNKANQFGF